MKKLFISAIVLLSLSGGYAHAQTRVIVDCSGGKWVKNSDGSSSCVQDIKAGGSGTATNGASSDNSTFCTGGSCTYVPLEPLPGLPNKYGPGNSFGSVIPGTFKLLIGAGATIAIVMIVLGALTYMFSDVVGNKKKALDRIRGAMWAIVLLLSSYLILYTLNPDLVQFKLNLSGGGNFNITPTPPGAVNIDQMTPAQRQAAIDQCRQEGKTVHPRSDGTLACQ